MHGSTLADRINTKTIYNETNLLSVNQLNAQIKLTEVWKSQNDNLYPIKWTKTNEVILRPGLKSSNKPDLVPNLKHSLMMQQRFVPRAVNDYASLHQSVNYP